MPPKLTVPTWEETELVFQNPTHGRLFLLKIGQLHHSLPYSWSTFFLVINMAQQNIPMIILSFPSITIHYNHDFHVFPHCISALPSYTIYTPFWSIFIKYIRWRHEFSMSSPFRAVTPAWRLPHRAWCLPPLPGPALWWSRSPARMIFQRSIGKTLTGFSHVFVTMKSGGIHGYPLNCPTNPMMNREFPRISFFQLSVSQNCGLP